MFGVLLSTADGDQRQIEETRQKRFQVMGVGVMKHSGPDGVLDRSELVLEIHRTICTSERAIPVKQMDCRGSGISILEYIAGCTRETS